MPCPILLTLALAALSLTVAVNAANDAPKPMRLWADNAPLSQGTTDADIPTITVYAPPADKANGAAVVVCPGGGYGVLAEHEGVPVAKWLTTLGVTGVVLKYRLGPRYHHPAMLDDVGRALRTIRAHAAEWHLDPRRVGVMGFSAGGHLASTAATHFDEGDANAADPIDRQSSRPDLAILIYPVITLSGPYAHIGSRNNLLGEHPTQEQIDFLSNEKQVGAKTPPTFLVHTGGDTVVPCENSIQFALALRRFHVPVELLIFEKGEHGFGLGNDEVTRQWPVACGKWMAARGFLKK